MLELILLYKKEVVVVVLILFAVIIFYYMTAEVSLFVSQRRGSRKSKEQPSASDEYPTNWD